LTFDLRLDAYWQSQGHTVEYSEDHKRIEVKLNFNDPAFLTNLITVNVLSEGHIEVKVKSQMTRSAIYKLLTIWAIPLITLAAFFITKIRNTDGFVQAIIALIFGLSSVKGIVIPSFINFPTLLDTLFYILFFYLLIIMLYEIYKRTNKQPKLLSVNQEPIVTLNKRKVSNTGSKSKKN